MSDFEKKINEFKNKIKSSTKIEEIDLLKSDVFGKNGIINLEFKKLGTLPPEEKKSFASNINKIKQDLLKIYQSKSEEITNKDIIEKVQKEKIDITLPEKSLALVKFIQFLQLLTKFLVFFQKLDFQLKRDLT